MARLLIAMLGGVCTIFLLKFGGEIEGRFFPVIGPIDLANPKFHGPPPYQYRWTGAAEKLRNCSFVRLEWFFGSRNGDRVSVDVGFTDPPTLRAAGRVVWLGIVIALSPSAIMSNSHADMLHKCRGRPWLVRTRVFDVHSQQN